MDFNEWYDSQPLVLPDRKTEHRLTWEEAQGELSERIAELEQTLRRRDLDCDIKALAIEEQSAEIEILKAALANSGNRHIYEAPEGMVFMPVGSDEKMKDQAAEINEQARLLGISAEKELALRAENERMKAELAAALAACEANQRKERNEHEKRS